MATLTFLFVIELLHLCRLIRYTESLADLRITKTSTAGQTVRLPCKPSVQAPVDWWYQRAENEEVLEVGRAGVIINGFIDRFGIGSDKNGSFDLIIEDVRNNDAGLYTCIEQAGLGRKHLIELTVTDAAKSVAAIVGQTVRLPCRTLVQAPVDWWYQTAEDEDVLEVGRAGVIINGFIDRFSIGSDRNGGFDLIIEDVRNNDTGLYTCIEQAGLGRKHIIRLEVTGVIVFAGVAVVSANSSVVFSCRMNTSLTTRWLFYPRSANVPMLLYNGYELNDDFSVRFSVRRESGVTYLSIRNVQKHDAGIYSCSPLHTANVKQKFELFVSGDESLAESTTRTTSKSRHDDGGAESTNDPVSKTTLKPGYGDNRPIHHEKSADLTALLGVLALLVFLLIAVLIYQHSGFERLRRRMGLLEHDYRSAGKEHEMEVYNCSQQAELLGEAKDQQEEEHPAPLKSVRIGQWDNIAHPTRTFTNYRRSFFTIDCSNNNLTSAVS